MPDTHMIDVPIPVEARFAERLNDPELRARASAAVNEVLRKEATERLIALMDEIGAEAERRGLTEDILEAELAAHKAERRQRRAASGA
jgi:hypothetical protein